MKFTILMRTFAKLHWLISITLPRETYVSPIDYLLNLRLEKAKDLLVIDVLPTKPKHFFPSHFSIDQQSNVKPLPYVWQSWNLAFDAYDFGIRQGFVMTSMMSPDSQNGHFKRHIVNDFHFVCHLKHSACKSADALNGIAVQVFLFAVL